MVATKQNLADSQTAFQEAFDAMTDWQEEVRSIGERHGQKVLTKLSVAAKSAGWPDAVVDASRNQIQLAAKAQAQALDQIMSVWRQQLDRSTTLCRRNLIRSPWRPIPANSGSRSRRTGRRPGSTPCRHGRTARATSDTERLLASG
jgi:hypothetical protein